MKKVSSLLLLLIMFVLIIPTKAFAATTNTGMDIYSIYIGEKNNGDATLIKSGNEYLLMDVGVYESYPYVDSFLRQLGVTHLSLYLSHFHGDHTGGFSNSKGEAPLSKLMKKYKIDNIYLPDRSLLRYKGVTIEKEEDTYYRKIQEYYENSSIQNKNYNKIVKYLNLGSKFSFGSVTVDIIGPVYTNKLKSPFVNGGTSGKINAELLDEYQNNCSLVAKLRCGKTTYLTAGDAKVEAENKLISKYGNNGTLKADIYKMSHHGLNPANSEKFLSYVKPNFSFVSNCNDSGLGETKKYWSIHTAMQNCNKYGFTYMLGQEKKTLHINVKNDVISLYRLGNNSKLNKKGWTKVFGNDGVYRKYDYYYFGTNGKTLKGVQKIDGKIYYLGTGGYRHTGTGSSKKGNYRGMTTCSEDNVKRYFYEKDDTMATGFKKIKDGTAYNGIYYFNKSTGKILTSNNKGWQKKKIGNNYYSIYKSGKLSTNVFKKYGKGTCYFGNDGKMLTGWQKINGKKYYLDKKTGYRLTGLQKIKNDYYFFSNYGILQKNINKTINGKKFNFDKKGKMTNIPKLSKPKITLKSSSKSINVKWKRKSNVDGYQIFYSTSKNGKYKKVGTVNSSTKSFKISKLQKGKRYYIKIRSYSKVGNYKVYSDYSSIKNVKVKR